MAVWSEPYIYEATANKRIDSEFFHPYFIESEERVLHLSETSRLGDLGDFLIGPFGSAFHVSSYDHTSSYRYIRGKDVKPFSLLNDDNVYIPTEDFHRLEKYAVNVDDLLISVVGTLGNVAIVPEGVEGIFSCKSTVFRNLRVDPYYLLSYLNCKYGRDCLLRRQRGAVQAGLNKLDLRTVPVPIFRKSEVNIANLVRSGLKKSEESKEAFNHAKGMLEKELGFDSLKLHKPRSYEVHLSEITNSNRVDAEYFNPQADEIYCLEAFQDSKPLKDVFDVIRGKTPSSYVRSGIPVLKTKNIRVPIIDETRVDDFTVLESSSNTIKNHDIVLAAMGRGSLGRVSYVFDDSSKAIIDGTLRLLRAKSGYENATIPTMLFLASVPGQILIYKGTIGSTGIISLPDSHLRNIRIPFISSEASDYISNLVIKSYNARIVSNDSLLKAKKWVEHLIEAGIEA